MRGWLWVALGCGPVAPVVDTGRDTEPNLEPVRQVQWQRHEAFLGPIVVSWTQARDGLAHVEYQVDDEWRQTPTIDGVVGENRITVLGIPLGTDAPFRVVLDDGSVFDGSPSIDAAPVPDELLTIAVEIDEPELWEGSGGYVLLPVNSEQSSSSRMAIVDRSGRPVWIAGHRLVLYTQVGPGGDHLVWGDAFFDVARRVRLDRMLDEVRLPGLYHTMVQLPDGTIAWPDRQGLLELAPGAVAPTEVWRGEGWPHVVAFNPAREMPYINGLAHDEASNSYLLSEWYTDAVVAVDRSSGRASWWTQAQNADFDDPDGGYGFAPIASAFDLQHGLQVTPDGHLRSVTLRSQGVVGAEYAVDHATRTLTEVDVVDSGEDVGEFSWVERLPNGNSLFTLGKARVVIEVTPDGTVAWRAVLQPQDRPSGKALVLDDLYRFVSP